jgi:hypothetical protein
MLANWLHELSSIASDEMLEQPAKTAPNPPLLVPENPQLVELPDI